MMPSPHVWLVLLFLLLAIGQVASLRTPTPDRRREDKANPPDPFQFIEDSCSSTQKEIIKQAFEDAKKMANAAHNEQGDGSLYAAMDIFGPVNMNKLGQDTVKSVFKEFLGQSWNLQITCDMASESSQCKDPYIFGGTFSRPQVSDPSKKNTRSENPGAVELVFCRSFFAMPSLFHAVSAARNNKTWYLRYSLSAYHGNQATSLLRELLHHLPQQAKLASQIKDLWIQVTTSESYVGTTWLGCYGVACARLLATLNDDNSWAYRNADNYALYALTRHLETSDPPIPYPWLPRPFQWTTTSDFVYPYVNSNGQVEIMIYDYANLGLFKHQKSPLGDIQQALDKSRKVDLSSVKFQLDERNYQQAFMTSSRNQLQNWASKRKEYQVDDGAKKTLECASTNSARFSKEQSMTFTFTQASASISSFCQKLTRGATNDEPQTAWDIFPYVSLGTAYNHHDAKRQSSSYTVLMPIEPADMGNGIFLHIGIQHSNDLIDSQTISISADYSFEGGTLQKKTDNCNLLFKDLLDLCDAGDQKRGGTRRIGGLLFDIVATKSKDSPLSRLGSGSNDMASGLSGPLECIETDKEPTLLWHALKSDLDPKYTCTCWYKNFRDAPDLFCRPTKDGCSGIVKNTTVPSANAIAYKSSNRPCGETFGDGSDNIPFIN